MAIKMQVSDAKQCTGISMLCLKKCSHSKGMILVAGHRNSPENTWMNTYVLGCVNILHIRPMSHDQL